MSTKPLKTDDLSDECRELREIISKSTRITSIAWIFTMVMLHLVTICVGVAIWRTHSALTDLTVTIKPNLIATLQAVDHISTSTSTTMSNILETTHSGSELTRITLPQLIGVVNSTYHTVLRLEQILEHPTVRMALGTGVRATE